MDKPMFWERIVLNEKEELYPTSRVGGCMLYIPEKKAYLLFGGENNTIVYHLDRLQSKQSTSPVKPGLKESCSVSMNSAGGKHSAVLPAVVTGKNDKIYFYDIETNKWRVETTKGKLPEFRTFFAYYYNAPYLIIHGGEILTKDMKPKNASDIYVLNVETLQWKRLFVMESPAGREMHILGNINNEYYVYGGMCLSDNYILNDLWVLNCDNVVWNTKLAEIPGAIWSQKHSTGESPGPLRGHGAAAYEKYLVIFGGEDDECKANDKLYFLDTETMVWSVPKTEGKPPEGRAFHQVQMLTESCLLISGGVRGGIEKESKLYNDLHILDLKTMQWSEPRAGGTLPSPRYAHSLAFRTDLQSEILVFGGLQSKHTLTNINIFVLRENSKEEQKNWYIVTADDKEEEAKVQVELQNSETVISEQKRKIGDLEANIRMLKESIFGYEQGLIKVKNELAEKEKKIEESTHVLIKNLNKAEIERNRFIQEIAALEPTFLNELKYKALHEEKCRMLQGQFQETIALMVSYDKVIRQRMEEQKERIKIEELKIIENERPRLAVMLKELQTDLAEISEKEEDFLAAAAPYESLINLNLGEDELDPDKNDP